MGGEGRGGRLGREGAEEGRGGRERGMEGRGGEGWGGEGRGWEGREGGREGGEGVLKSQQTIKKISTRAPRTSTKFAVKIGIDVPDTIQGQHCKFRFIRIVFCLFLRTFFCPAAKSQTNLNDLRTPKKLRAATVEPEVAPLLSTQLKIPKPTRKIDLSKASYTPDSTSRRR